MRNAILAAFFFLLVPWELNRKNAVIQSPEVHVDQEGIVQLTPQPAEIPLIFRILYPWAVPRDVVRGSEEAGMEEEKEPGISIEESPEEGIVQTTPQPAEIPLIFRILYPWAVPRDVVRGSEETRMEVMEPTKVLGECSDIRMEEENMKRTEQPVEEPISRFLFLTRPPFLFSLALLITLLVLKNVLRQNDLARILGLYMMFLELSGLTNLLINIWNSRGISFKNMILELLSWILFLTRTPFWFSWALLICVPILKHVLRQNHLTRVLGHCTMFLQLSGFIYLVIDIWNNGGTYFENSVPPLLIEIVTEHRSECFLGVITMLVVLLLIYFKLFYRLFRPTSSNITPPTSDTISPTFLPASKNAEITMEETDAPVSRVTPPTIERRNIISQKSPTTSENAASTMEETGFPIPRGAPSCASLSARLSQRIEEVKSEMVAENGNIAMEETDVHIPGVAPPQASLNAILSQHIEELQSEMVDEHSNIISQKSDITTPSDVVLPPTREIVASAMEETGFPIPRVAPPCASLSARIRQHIEEVKAEMVAENGNIAMEETDVHIPRVTLPRGSPTAILRQFIEELQSEMVDENSNIISQKRDITTPSDVVLPPTSEHSASAMEETGFPIPRVAPPCASLSARLRQHIEEVQSEMVAENGNIAMEETDVHIPGVAPPRDHIPAHTQDLFQPVKKRRPLKVFRDSNIIPTSDDIIPTTENVYSSMEETDVPIPRVSPPRASLSARLSQHIEEVKAEMVAENGNIAMEETDIHIPRVAPPRGSLSARIRRHIEKLQSEMVAENGNITMKMTDVHIPRVAPPRGSLSARIRRHIEEVKAEMVAENGNFAMEETDIHIPRVAPSRGSLSARIRRHIEKLQSEMVAENGNIAMEQTDTEAALGFVRP